MAASTSVADLESLQRRAAALKTEADAVTRTYNRTTWIRFVGVFFPVPLVVVIVRLYLDAWGYYLAGAAFFVSAAVLFAVDSAAAAKRDAAIEAAERARQAVEDARRTRGVSGTPAG